MMVAAFHIAALAALGWMAGIWSGTGLGNVLIKTTFIGLALWAAVVVAKDWFV